MRGGVVSCQTCFRRFRAVQRIVPDRHGPANIPNCFEPSVGLTVTIDVSSRF